MHRRRRDNLSRRVPVPEYLLPLGPAQPQQLRDAPLRMHNRIFENRLVGIPQANHGRLVEKVGVVLQLRLQSFSGVDDVQAQLVGGRSPLPDDAAPPVMRAHESVQRRVLEHEQDLEDRRTGEVARRPQLLHQLLERDVTVGEGLQAHPPLPGQQLAERGVARQVRAQHERVHEQAQHPLGLEQ